MKLLQYPPLVIAALAGLPLVQPHGVMNSPRPYNLHTAPLLEVNPLGPSNKFPCQGRFFPEEVTSVAAGEDVLVNFTIGADHHGGSCQFSVTYDDPVTAAKSKWKTVYSIIGGCPAQSSEPLTANIPPVSLDTDGRQAISNCGNDTGTDCIRQFNIPFPTDMPNGNATFAWTWFNSIGNREMYMNCAPITVTNGADNNEFFDQLPEMFVANIAGECNTTQGIFYFPEAGKFGKVLQEKEDKLSDSDAQGNCGTVVLPTFEYDPGSTSSASGTSSDIATSPATSASLTTVNSGGPSPSLSSSSILTFYTIPYNQTTTMTTGASSTTSCISIVDMTTGGPDGCVPYSSQSNPAPTSASSPSTPSTSSAIIPSTSSSSTPSTSSAGTPSTSSSSSRSTSSTSTGSTSSPSIASSTASLSSTASSSSYDSHTGTSTGTTTNTTNVKRTTTTTLPRTQPGTSATPTYPGYLPCSEVDGTWICFDDGTMGMCVHGYVQKIKPAAGMMCSSGSYVAIPTSM